MKRQPEIFASLHQPYYLVAPRYIQTSGGVRAMHYLCHALNLLGEEAYVTTPGVHPQLRTPILTQEIRKAHERGGRSPIGIYPEVVSDNPLKLQNVTRYLLAEPALHTGKPIELQPRDQVFTFGPTLVPPGWKADLLRIPLVDRRIFHRRGVDESQRHGTAVFINRHLRKGGQLHPITADSIEISRRVQERTAQELAEIFRQVECLYMYEYSTVCFEALLCGCPIVFIMNETSLQETTPWLMGGNGISWTLDPADIARAKATVHAADDFYREEENEFWRQLEAFVEKTQANALGLDGKPLPEHVEPIALMDDAKPSEIDIKTVRIEVPAPSTQKRRLAVYSIDSPESVEAQARLILPFAHLGEEWELLWGVNAKGQIDTDILLSADAIVLHDATPGLFPSTLLQLLFDSGKPLIYETVATPEQMLARTAARGLTAQLPHIELALEKACAVVVPTEKLASLYEARNPQVFVLPSLVDSDLFQRSVFQQAGDQVRIGIVLGAGGINDFAVLDPVLRELSERHRNRVRLCFIGELPSSWREHAAIEHMPAIPVYQAYAERLRNLDIDIALLPQSDVDSAGLAWLEYATLGAATVCSDVPMHRLVVDHGRTGLLAGASSETWLAAVESLIADPKLRRRLARTAQAEVRKHYSLQANAWFYRDLYLRLMGAQPSAHDDSAGVPGILVLDAEGDALAVNATLDALAQGPYAGLVHVVLTTRQDDLPEWTDQLRFMQVGPAEYSDALEQLSAVPDFDWALIVEAGGPL